MPRGRPFPKGVSGNPSGRPKLAKEIRDMLRDPELAKLFVEKVKAGLKRGDAKILALYGKHVLPAETEVQVSGSLDTSPARALTTEQLRELAQKK